MSFVGHALRQRTNDRQTTTDKPKSERNGNKIAQN